MKTKRSIPYAFVLELLDRLGPVTRPMFGCTSVYVGDKIVLILREKESYPRDSGVWIATEREHHASLKREFPDMRSIELFESKEPTNWQNIPSDSVSFESSVERLCELILKRDPRVGRIPKARGSASKKKQTSKQTKKRKSIIKKRP